MEAIDGACIEPLSYRLAYAVAREAVGGPADSEEDKEQEAANVTNAMASPEKVEALNLEVWLQVQSTRKSVFHQEMLDRRVQLMLRTWPTARFCARLLVMKLMGNTFYLPSVMPLRVAEGLAVSAATPREARRREQHS